MKSNNQTIKQSNNFHPGFTVLELLVASLLLGMLMTILTMIFNQSSIAWRTGEAGVTGVGYACVDVSDVRYQADNGYEWNGAHYINSVFKEDGTIATRSDYIKDTFESTGNLKITLADGENVASSYQTDIPRTPSNSGSADNYIVNVMSFGPDRKEDTRYDNIYSIPPTDNPSEW